MANLKEKWFKPNPAKKKAKKKPTRRVEKFEDIGEKPKQRCVCVTATILWKAKPPNHEAAGRKTLRNGEKPSASRKPPSEGVLPARRKKPTGWQLEDPKKEIY